MLSFDIFYENPPSIMAEYREKKAIPTNSLSPTEENLSSSRCIANVAEHVDHDEMFKIFLYVHSYGLGTLHLCLAIFVLFMLYKLWFTLKRRRPFIAVIHILVLCFAIFRSYSTTATGHIFNANFGFSVQLIGDLGIPALTSAYALTVWVMFEIGNVRVSRKLQSKAFLAIIIVSHFVFIVVVDIVVGLNNGTCVLLLTCQIFNVFWGLILTVLFLIATKRIYKIRRQQEKFFRPRAFSKPVLDQATESLASIAMPINNVGIKELGCTGEEESGMEASKVFPFIMTVNAPLVEDRSESTFADGDAVFHSPLMDPHVTQSMYHKSVYESPMDRNGKENGFQLDFRQRDLKSHEMESTTSKVISNVGIEKQVNEIEVSTSNTTTNDITEKAENGSRVNQFQFGGKRLWQPNDDVGDVKCDEDSDGIQGTSSEKGDTEKTDHNSPDEPSITPTASRPDMGKLSCGKTETVLRVDCNTTRNSYNLSREIKYVSQLSRENPRTPRKEIKTDVRQRFVSTRVKNPTKKLETVGILSVILGAAQVLLGFIGTSYIYNPQLVGKDGEPNPLVWLLFTTILRILELLFGLVLTFLAWQRSDSRITNNT